MYDLKVVKRKKAKKVVTAVASISVAGILILCAVALLGTQSGAFTVALKQGSNKSFGLAEKLTSDSYQTYMTTGKVPEYDEFTFPNFYNDQGNAYYETLADMDADIDNDATNNAYIYSETTSGVLKFFKYTFYVVNYGTEPVNYTSTLMLKNAVKAKNGLESILRVGFYENKVAESGQPETHNHKFYAKAASEYETYFGSTADNPEVHQINEYRERLYDGSDEFCEMFETSNKLVSSSVADLMPGEKMRYTYLFWLEGSDPDCYGEAPLDNRLKMSVSINVDE